MNLETIVTGENYLQVIKIKSGKIIVFADTPKFILIPEEFYSDELREQYFRLTHGIANDEIILENRVTGDNYKILFALKKKLKDKIVKSFPSAPIVHYTSLLQIRLSAQDSENRNKVLINKQAHHSYILINNNKKLVYLNSFQLHHVNDIIYYTLKGLKENVVDPYQTIMFYEGFNIKDDKMLTLLRKYFFKVLPLTPFETEHKYDQFSDFLPFTQARTQT